MASYLAGIEECRERFLSLRVVSGVEVGEPHLHHEAVARTLAPGGFERVLGSLHCLPDGAGYAEPPGLFDHRAAADVLRDYLAEVVRMVSTDEPFTVLAHIDYPVRSWPADAGPFDVAAFEDDFREALRATARSGRALEVSTVVPLSPTIVRWWHQEGGEAVTFGSDAHDPDALARGFADAVAMAEQHGFRPGRDPVEPWARG